MEIKEHFLCWQIKVVRKSVLKWFTFWLHPFQLDLDLKIKAPAAGFVDYLVSMSKDHGQLLPQQESEGLGDSAASLIGLAIVIYSGGVCQQLGVNFTFHRGSPATALDFNASANKQSSICHSISMSVKSSTADVLTCSLYLACVLSSNISLKKKNNDILPVYTIKIIEKNY